LLHQVGLTNHFM